MEVRHFLSGDVAFADSVEFLIGESDDFPIGIVAADFDDDGKLDLAVAASKPYSVNLLRGNGDGTFAEPEIFRVNGTGGNNQLATGDLDGDGDLDLVVNSNNTGVSVLLNAGDGTFPDVVDFETGINPTSVAVGDLDGDGDLDLAVGHRGRFPAYSEAGVSVLINSGNAGGQWEGFAEPVQHEAGKSPTSVVIEDLDGDGDLDLAVASSLRFESSSDDVSILLGNGDGTFADRVSYRANGALEQIAAGDLDGDGDLDLVVGRWGHPRGSRNAPIAVLRGNGDGTFVREVDNYDATPSSLDGGPTKWSAESVSLADLNADGHLDVAVTHSTPNINGAIVVMLGNGDATFADPVSFAVKRTPAAIVSGDFDGDSDLDLVTTNFYTHNVSVLLNMNQQLPLAGDANRDGVFDQLDIVEVLQAAKYLTGQPATFAEGDWDGNGVFDQLDIVAALATGRYLQT